jgi:hypothetical protein
VIADYLLAFMMGVSHAPGWSEPVITIEVPATTGTQRKDILVTDGEHVHQIWSKYSGNPRIGYNIVLHDGTILVPDTLFSRDVWSAYPSSSYIPDSGLIGFWREYTPKWYSTKDHEGNTIVPATFYSGEGWSWWTRIDSSLDSLGRVHMVWDIGPEVCYSILDPGVGELWRDTIPDSRQQSLVLVDGDRVHIKFNGPDQWADYIQYDLDGNVIVPRIDLTEESLDETNRSSIAVDADGNAMIFLEENPDDGLPRYLALYKIDRDTGALLIDCKIIYQPSEFLGILGPQILPRPGRDSFYLVWLEEEPGGGHIKYVKFAIIDTNGDFVEEPYIAYDYTDEDPEDLHELAATTNQAGDVFIIYSEGDPDVNGYWIRLGWFDHNWVGIEEEPEEEAGPSELELAASCNPFSEMVTITAVADPLPRQLAVYDLSGRLIRSLGNGRNEGVFLWDGADASGEEVPPGTYLIRAASAGRLASLRLVKL